MVTKIEMVNGTNITREIKVANLTKYDKSYYFKIYNVWCDIIFNGIIPFVILIFLNLSILSEMQKYKNKVEGDHREEKKRKHELQMAIVSVIIVAVFIISHTIQFVPSVVEFIWKITPMIELRFLSHVMIVFNSSINFYVFWLKRYERKKSDKSNTNKINGNLLNYTNSQLTGDKLDDNEVKPNTLSGTLSGII